MGGAAGLPQQHASSVDSPQPQPQPQPEHGLRPAVVLGGAAALVAAITAAAAPFLAPGLLRSFGVPFNPTEAVKLRAMLRHLPRRSSGGGTGLRATRPLLVDLGSGDGRVVVAAAQQGWDALGYEMNPWLVMYSRASALGAGVSPVRIALRRLRSRLLPITTHFTYGLNDDGSVHTGGGPARGSARFVCGDMWAAPVSEASCVVIYGVDELMGRFATKLQTELPPPLNKEEGWSEGEGRVTVMSNTFHLPGWEERLITIQEGVYIYSTLPPQGVTQR